MALKIETKREQVGQLRNPVTLPEPPDHLKAVASGSLVNLVALMFWKMRHANPDFAMTFTESDITGMQQSMDYNEQTPKLVAEARQDYVVLRVEDEKTGDMIRVSENNEADLAKGEQAKKVRRIRESASMLVATVRGELSQGVTSNDSINALCDSLLALARE